MEPEEAAQHVADVDARENTTRAERLRELDGLLDDDLVGFSGLAAEWLFEDVKATWIYGYFTATVLAAHAFCLHQLAGLIRLMPDDPTLPDAVVSLDQLAGLAESRRLIDVDLRAQLVTLDDAARTYTAVGLHEYDANTERRMLEADRFTDEHGLVADARCALVCSVSLLHRSA